MLLLSGIQARRYVLSRCLRLYESDSTTQKFARGLTCS